MIGKGVIIEGDVDIGKNVIIGNYCVIRGNEAFPTVIGNDCVINDFTVIYPGVSLSNNSFIGERVTLGHPSKEMLTGTKPSDVCPTLKKFENNIKGTYIDKGANIRSGTVIYSNVEIGKNLNTGHNAIIREHTIIGNNCIVGGLTEMNGFTIVGDGTTISELIVTCQAMKIGSGVYLGGFLSFSENKYSIPGKVSQGPCIEDYVRIGTGSSLMADTIIGKYSIIGAHSLVTRSIPEKTLAFGSPAKAIRELKQIEIDEYVNAMNNRINIK